MILNQLIIDSFRQKRMSMLFDFSNRHQNYIYDHMPQNQALHMPFQHAISLTLKCHPRCREQFPYIIYTRTNQG